MTNFKKNIVVLLVLIFVIGLIPINIMPVYTNLVTEAAVDNEDVVIDSELDYETYSDIKYEQYIDQYTDDQFNGETIYINNENIITSTDCRFSDDVAGVKAVVAGEESIIQWEFIANKSGLYRIEVDYFPYEGTGSAIERAIYLNGDLPFSESYNVIFSRVYKDEGPIVAGGNGNDLRPQQIEAPEWRTVSVTDQFGYFTDAMYYYIETGINTITFNAVREPMAIGEVRLVSEKVQYLSYEDYIEEKIEAEVPIIEGQLEAGVRIVQAETTAKKSDPTLYPINDVSSPATMPQDVKLTKLNVVGGTRWSQPGQWLTWEVHVPRTGLYKIGIRSKQNIYRDMNASRSLYINGEIPFREAQDIVFNYSDDWQVSAFGNNDRPFLFFLEQGTNEITLSVSMGYLRNILLHATRILSDLNQINLQFISLMGTIPDVDRDYQIDRFMPEVLEDLAEQSQHLQQMRQDLIEAAGQSDEMVAQLDQLIFIIDTMVKDPSRVARSFPRYRDMVNSFGFWIMETQQQPLLVDYIFIAENQAELPLAEKNIIANLWFSIKKFVASFFIDYSLLSEDLDDEAAITVWIGNGLTGGRDQALALNKMIAEDFTNIHGIPVRLQLVPPGTILSATLAGRGPDVAIQIGGNEPVNYAMRKAVVDVSQFSDFPEIAERFHPETFTSFKYMDGVYALPEAFSFPMLFYRKDIFRDLGISVDDLSTWDDIINLLASLQHQNMTFGLFPDLSTFATFLYQRNGSFYNDNFTESALDSKISVDAFTFWMDFYTNYGLLRDFSFINRFRTGEMPVGIADYTTYNLLSVSAPEIKGQWGMTEIPGTRQPDGSIDRTAPTFNMGAVIMSGTNNKESSWEFLKWWTSADAQYIFGRELESVMGPAARYNTANIEAMNRLPWSAEDRRKLMSQMEKIKGIPEVPGGYYTGRYIDFAKIAVYDRKENPKDVLFNYVDEINAEIRHKRIEFGLDN